MNPDVLSGGNEGGMQWVGWVRRTWQVSVGRSDHLVKSLVTFIGIELGQTLTYTISPDVLALFNYLESEGCDKIVPTKTTLYKSKFVAHRFLY